MTPLDSESKSIIEDTLLRFIEESYDPVKRHKRIWTSPIDYRQYWATFGLNAKIVARPASVRWCKAIGPIFNPAIWCRAC